MKLIASILFLIALTAYSTAEIIPEGTQFPCIFSEAPEAFALFKCAQENAVFCSHLEECEILLAEPVRKALRICEAGRRTLQEKECYFSSRLFATPDAIEKFGACMIANTPKLTSDEKRMQVDVEDCGLRIAKSECRYFYQY